MAVSNMGNIIGKAKMAVKVELLFVFEAMAETKVSTPEKPRLPNTITSIKAKLSSKGFPNKTLKKSQLIKAISNIKKPLKSSLESMMDCGLHKL